MSLIILALFLLPLAMQLNHVVSDHHHKVCDNFGEQHLHDEDVVCDLSKYTITFNFLIPDLSSEESDEQCTKEYANRYQSLTSYIKNSFRQLRAPPALV
jgi:hypothetical protein